MRENVPSRHASHSNYRSGSEESLENGVTSMPGMEAPVPVINRLSLKQVQKIEGPALITETISNTWLALGWSAEADPVGNLKLIKI